MFHKIIYILNNDMTEVPKFIRKGNNNMLLLHI